MATTTYAVTMADSRDPHAGLWSSYGSHLYLSTPRFGHGMDSKTPSHSATATQAGRPRTDTDPSSYSNYRYAQDTVDTYDRHATPSLTAPQSYPNLKRPYSQVDQPPYPEIVQDLRDDGSRLNVKGNHKLLFFQKGQGKQTTVDQHGRMQQLELSAQLHGMFFMSEAPTTVGGGTTMQPELTCYRRNLFQVSGSLIAPRGPISVLTESGETIPVESTEVTISAIESVDNHPVRLIVIPWKTPPPNPPEITQTPDQEPTALPLIPFQDDGHEVEGEYAVYPIGWRRLQFRV